ncbi:Helix-turn-helix domain-containing protein [Actinokineospora alba]|uniref:Helix-turn-helix domain-containing protein n=1 Tax=Actinokineospora alba TaxID=504798 RepID=A0A1H0WMR1_9PSEU|nr:helix-turn-helix domain-containing protein [Actinokineospora alba]TDP67168.1 helix-turn-helix protein [Actinokineospora alba]SDJ53713.1 Helix-turn-helix domain-containing protein [Actinokineospora alba]SDP92010.1 Helix-turn-helix domain-containing protein [Actinokineospora alba]
MTDLSDSTSNPSFGQALLRYRTTLGLSQAELARLSGLSVRALRELERGRAAAAQERSAALLASALGLEGDERESFVLLAKEGRRRSARSGNRTMLYALPTVPGLVGREPELERLSREAKTGGVVVVAGPPGVGKTVLAVAAADRLAAQFPDGCLALDLRGVDDRPMKPGVALERMLTALGVPPSRIPAGDGERGSLYRTLLRDRRVLVVLDNAADEAQVRPLLASGERGLTIVTCRRVLAGLEAARWLMLHVLPAESAIDLLTSIVGEDLVRNEPEAANEVVALCGSLPLAVRIVGNRLAARRGWSLAHLVRQLRDERMRLDSLSAGDLQLRSAFEVSLRRLSPMAQVVFRRLALIPGAHFDHDMAAVSVGVAVDKIDLYLDELVEASLLNVTSASRHLQFHDLLRLFARECLAKDEPEQTRNRLRDALYTHVLWKASAAGRLVYPDVSSVHPDGPFLSQAEAKEWLDSEATNWLAAQREVAALGRYREALDFALAMHRHVHGRELEYRWDEVFEIGVRAARELGDQVAEVEMLTQLAWAQLQCLDDGHSALASTRGALSLAHQIGYQRGIMVAHACAGTVLLSLGCPEEGMKHNVRAYEMSMEYDFFDVRFSMATALATALQVGRRFEEALDVYRTLLSEAESLLADTNREMIVKVILMLHTNMGDCFVGLERWAQAAHHYHEAASLVIGSEPGDRSEAELALCEGIAWRKAGEHQRARTRLSLALDLLVGPAHHDDRARAEAELALLPD